ncbi:MAG: hypothetical protein M3O31_10795 [Acidobacteriota bacterium]|nr:hypothetical protein [Acidobacteriota bacterium]
MNCASVALFVVLVTVPLLGQVSQTDVTTTDVTDAVHSTDGVQKATPSDRGFVKPVPGKDEKQIPHEILIDGKRYPAAVVHGTLTSQIDSWTAKVGDKIEVSIPEQSALPDGTVVPKGSKALGTVENVTTHGHGVKNSAIALRVGAIQFPDKSVIPVIARLKIAQQPVVPGSTSVGMPGASSYNISDSGTGYFEVLPDLGPGVIVRIDRDLTLQRGTVLTFAMMRARATPEASAAAQRPSQKTPPQ